MVLPAWWLPGFVRAAGPGQGDAERPARGGAGGALEAVWPSSVMMAGQGGEPVAGAAVCGGGWAWPFVGGGGTRGAGAGPAGAARLTWVRGRGWRPAT
jgi:hypothetical protein